MPLVTFNGIMVGLQIGVPDELMKELFWKAKKEDVRQFPASYVDAESARLGLKWRMPTNWDYLQINIIE